MTDNRDFEGYPDSPADELRPESEPVSLDEADRELRDEGEVDPEGAAPETGDREEALADSPDADQLAAMELGAQGSHPEDAANFEDNAADWSRDRG